MVRERLKNAKGYLESEGGVEGKRLQLDRKRKRRNQTSAITRRMKSVPRDLKT
jgi:hypothetical protein